MKFISESIYWHGIGKISSCLNRILQDVLGMYEGYPENKFRLRILLQQRCGHDGAQTCRVFGFFVKARTQFADI